MYACAVIPADSNAAFCTILDIGLGTIPAEYGTQELGSFVPSELIQQFSIKFRTDGYNADLGVSLTTNTVYIICTS